MPAETTKEHQWLQRMAGEWTYEMEAEGQPGEPPIRESGTESVRSLQGVWVLAEAQSTMPDGGVETSLMTLGYDSTAGRFTGTFISSMGTYLWLYTGALDAGGTTLTLEAEGPSYTREGEMAKYRDTIEFRGDDHRVHTSIHQGDDGGWHQFMTVHYRRRQPARAPS